ncbi:hypothetical protein D3C75_716110 [compost metagenome]
MLLDIEQHLDNRRLIGNDIPLRIGQHYGCLYRNSRFLALPYQIGSSRFQSMFVGYEQRLAPALGSNKTQHLPQSPRLYSNKLWQGKGWPVFHISRSVLYIAQYIAHDDLLLFFTHYSSFQAISLRRSSLRNARVLVSLSITTHSMPTISAKSISCSVVTT